MDSLKKIYDNSHKYGICSEYIANDTLRLYTKNYIYDTWLLEKRNDFLILKHSKPTRKNNHKNIYHFQRKIKDKKWYFVLDTIKNHNHFEIYKKNNSNLKRIEYVMRQYRKYHN